MPKKIVKEVIPVIKPASKREKIREDLNAYYEQMVEKFKERPIILENNLIEVKFISTEIGFCTCVDIRCEPHITPDHFLQYYKNIPTEAKNITPECTSHR